MDVYRKNGSNLDYLIGPSELKAGASDTTTNDNASNGNVYLKTVDKSGVISAVHLKGDDGITVTSNSNGDVVISGSGSGSSNVVGTPRITCGDSVIIGGTLSVTFSATALLSGASITSFTYTLDGATPITVSASNNEATVNIPVGGSYQDGDQIDLVVSAKDNYENQSQNATKTISLVDAHVDQPTLTLGNASIYPNATENLTGSTFSSTGASDTLAEVEFAVFPANTTTGTKVWTLTGMDITATIPANTLAAGTYYVGMRYRGASLGWSDWSNLQALTVNAAYIVTPSITLGQNSIYPNGAVTLTGSALAVTGGTANLSDIDFALFSTNDTTQAAVWESTGHTNTSVTIPANTLTAGTYYAAVREKDADLGWSNWSATASLTVNAPYINAPTISSPTANAEIMKPDGLTVILNSISVTGGTDTQESVQVDICSDSAGTSVAKTKNVSGTGNTVTFSSSELSSLAENTTYYLCAYRTGTQFGQSSKSSRIAVTFRSISSTLEDNSWATIASIGAAGTGDTYWDVGDTKSVALSGTVGTLTISGTYKVCIIDFNYNGIDGVYFQGFKNSSGTDICLCDSAYNSGKTDGSKVYNMNHWGNYNHGGWKGCDLRYDILGSTEKQPSSYGAAAAAGRTGYDATAAAKTSPVSNTLMAALPSALRSVLSPWTVYSDNKGGGWDTASNISTSVDYLPLLSEFEVHGARTCANSSEKNSQVQMKYYANGNSKIKYKHDAAAAAARWWLRSPTYGTATGFCLVDTNGNAYYGGASYSYGLAPAFRLAG